MTTTLTPALIDTHERLYPRLAALLKQVERIAPHRSREAVPEETARLARELCREAGKLLGREGRGIVVPRTTKAAPLDHARLAVALGQAVAGLEAFEAAHSGWSAQRKCAVWSLDGPPRPVLRLLPPGTEANPVETHDPNGALYRGTVHRAFMARYSSGYDDGYRDAKAGIAPRADWCVRVWDHLCELRGGAERARRLGLKEPPIDYTNPPEYLVPTGAVLDDPKTRDHWF